MLIHINKSHLQVGTINSRDFINTVVSLLPTSIHRSNINSMLAAASYFPDFVIYGIYSGRLLLVIIMIILVASVLIKLIQVDTMIKGLSFAFIVNKLMVMLFF